MKNNKKTEKDIKSKKVEIQIKRKTEEIVNEDENENILENEYDPKVDPEHVIIFDCELDNIQNNKVIDLIFLIDTTGSMNCYLKGIQKIMRKIIWDIQKCLSKFLIEEIDVLKVGIVSYKDHEDENKTYLTNIDLDLTGNLNDADNKIMELTCSGGKDEPECVFDGLQKALYDINWRDDSIKYIYHILDAPCHGKQYNNIEGDKLEKCPNEIDIEKLFTEMRSKNINYFVIKLNDSIDIMVKEFKKMINLEVLTPKVYCDKTQVIIQD